MQAANGWQDEDWIGLGLKYASCAHLPLVQKQKQYILHIPGAFANDMPLPGLSMKAFLRRMDPVTQSSAIGEKLGTDLFVLECPNAGLEHFFKAPILPPSDTIDELWKNFGQYWFDGNKSVMEFTHPNTRYPLSIVAVYREFSCANKVRMEWNRAEDWMLHGKRTPELIDTIAMTQRLMFTFKWDSELRAIYTTVPVLDLFGILNDGRRGWLNDTHIDMLMQLLTDRLERKHEDCDVLIASCVFQQYLLQAYDRRNDSKQRKIPLLEQYKQEFLTRRKRRLFFTGHVNENHWVPWMFDNSKMPVIGHGDSLHFHENIFARLKSALLWWISELLGSEKECTYGGNILVHGDQSGDLDSCGILSYNTIAHVLFGDELWTISSRKRFRIEAFNTIIMRHNAHNNPPLSITKSYLPRGQKSQDTVHKTEVADPPSCALQYKSASSSDLIVCHSIQTAGQGLRTVLQQESVEDPISEEQGAQVQGLQIPLDSHRSGQTVSYVPQGGQECPNESVTDVRTKDVPGAETSPVDSASIPTEVTNASLQKLHWSDKTQHNVAKKPNDEVNGGPSTRNKRTREATGLGTCDDKAVNTNGTFVVKGGPLDAFFSRTEQTQEDKSVASEDTDDDKEDEIEDTEGDPRGHELVVGVSKSAINSKKLREAFLSGTFNPNETHSHKFKNKIRGIDPRAQFNPEEWSVRHSRCRRWVKMKGPYNVQNFRTHIRRCKVGPTLDNYSFTQGSLRLPNKPPEEVPCCGLTADRDARIETYLARPAALGGGGKSKVSIAKERYRRTYASLNKKEKKCVDKMQEDSWVWVVKHSFKAVYSTACKKSVSICATNTSEKDVTCAPCLALLGNKYFRAAVSLPEPQVSNIKFANKVYQQEDLGIRFAKCKGVDELLNPKNDGVRVAVCYAKGVARGEFKEHVVFTGLVSCVLQRLDRTARGKKLTNFKYPPAFDAFIQTVHLVCPRAHRLLADHFPVRTERSLEKLRAKQPQFVGGISSRSFDLADTFVSALNVPQRVVGLSADDTKLLPTFRPFFDHEIDSWCIVGGTGEALLVTDPITLREELEDAQQQKATKVRIWAIIVPLPKIPPIILAAIAISDNISADTLTSYTHEIINGLHERNIWPVSYACDGTEKERTNQRNLRSQAHGLDIRIIRSPSPVVKDIEIKIPLYHGKPMALVQDSQHAKKTFRNNLESGTTTLVFGNESARYGQLREAAFDDKSPLFHRDVEKTDKQDDRAAARIFSSDTLSWFVAYRPAYLGMQTYLFIYGDLCDAWQSRSNTLLDRLQSVLRAHYFQEIWQNFLQDAGYPIRKHCISREALDISRYLVESFIELLLIYRDYTDGNLPLVTWLHSSEVCEHIFGELRKEVKDFDFASFLTLMPKSHAMVRYRMELGSVPIHDAKARARGYAHTWLDLEGLSLSNLRAFPTDAEIAEAANEAYKDAADLWEQLGLYPGDICLKPEVQVSTCTVEQNNAVDNDEGPLVSEDDSEEEGPLPSVSHWYSDIDTLQTFVDMSPEELEESTIEDTSRAVLEKWLAHDEQAYENGPIRTEEVDNSMLNISCAKLVLDFDTMLRIDEIIVPSTEEWDQFYTEYARQVGTCLADNLPPIVGQLNPLPVESDLRLPPSCMLALRQSHETQFTKNAVRTTMTAATAAATAARMSEIEDSRARHSLIKKINDVLKLTQQDQGIGTGMERNARWTASTTSGNSANAGVVKAVNASEAKIRRIEIYSRFRFPRTVFNNVSNGRINEETLLREGSFALIFVNKCVLAGKVITMYTKANGKHGRYSYIPDASNIGQLSYIALQTFEHTSNRHFRAIHSNRVHLRVRSFAHIHPNEFLFKLPDIPKEMHNGNSIELSDESYRLWWSVQGYVVTFSKVMKEFRKRKQ